MRLIIRALSILGAILLVLVSVSGCGESAGDAGGAADKVILWHSMGDDLGKVLDSIVKKFNEGRTGPKVQLGYQGDYSLLKQKITMAIKAGNCPDMAQMYESWTAYYNSEPGKEALVPLDDYIKADPGFNTDDIYPVFIKDNTWHGKIWSFPCTKSLPVIFYNKEIFKKAGLDPDKPPRTWDEFAETGRKLTRDENGDGRPEIWGWCFVVDPWVTECMVLQQGAELARSDVDILPFNRPEYLKSLRYQLDAIEGPGRFATVSTGREFQNDFVAQKVAMIITTSVSRAFIASRIRFDWATAPLPTFGKDASIMAGTNVGIFKTSPPEKRKVAWEFIKFFCNPENTAYWALHTGYVPVRRSAVKSEAFQAAVKKDPTPLAAVTQIEYSTFEPRAPQWYDIRDQLGKAIEKALHKEMKPEEALDWATKMIAESLKKAPAP